MKRLLKPLHYIMTQIDRPYAPIDPWSDAQQIAISTYSMFCIMSKSAKHLHICTNLIGLTCLIDFRKRRSIDIVFHHVITILMSTFVHKNVQIKNQIVSVYHQDQNIYDIIRTILAIEIPTILLAFEKYIPEEQAKVKVAVQSAFALSFFYYRIYRYIRYVILDKEAKQLIDKTAPRPIDRVHIYCGVYGMFLLNIYWFSMIVRKGLKILTG